MSPEQQMHQTTLDAWKGLAAYVIAERTGVTQERALEVVGRVLRRHATELVTPEATLQILREMEGELR